MLRVRAIANALFYGLAPWWLYEHEKHYPGWSYLHHLGVNLCLAARWLTFRETTEDRQLGANATPTHPPVSEAA